MVAYGPKWLTHSETSWKLDTSHLSTNERSLQEERKKWLNCIQLQTSNTTMEDMFDRISSWRKLIRIVNYCIRFIKNSKEKLNKSRNFDALTTTELQLGERACTIWCQGKHYFEEITSLKKSKSVMKTSKLSLLGPFIDGQGILRVGGRLHNAECPYDTKHPIILPNSQVLSKMIAKYYHSKYLHPGPSLLFSLLKQKFWIVNGRSMVRGIAHGCHVCVRQRATTSSQLMGTLPTARVTTARPFSKVGVDFCGPISIASKKRRGARFIKAYIYQCSFA